MQLPEGVTGDRLRAALNMALAWSGRRARGDAFVEDSLRITFEHRDGRTLGARSRRGRGASVRTWTGDGVRFAAADGVPGLALPGALKQLGLPAARAGAAEIGSHDKEDASAAAPGQVEAADSLTALHGELERGLPGVAVRSSLVLVTRRTAVAGDGGGVHAATWRWARLRVEVGREGEPRTHWSGGAPDPGMLRRRFPAGRLLPVLERRLAGCRPADRPQCSSATPVLFAAGRGALLLHELTHGLEADSVLRGWSPWTESPGSRQGRALSPLLTLWDDPSRRGLPGSFDRDDEGTPADRRLLVRRGKVTGRLGDRRSSESARGILPGHGRRSSWQEWPLPRAGNLVMAGGTDLPQSVRGEKGSLLVVHDLEAGGTDPRTGALDISVSDAEWLDSGKVVGPVSGLSLAGNALETAAAVDRVCNDAGADGGALTCGRDGHGVPIGLFAPTFRTRGLRARSPG